MSKIKKIGIYLLSLIIILSFVSCGTSDKGAANSTEKADNNTGMNESIASKNDKEIVIGVTMQGNSSGFIRYITSGIYEYQKDYAPEVKIEVLFADDDAAKQQSQIETFVSKKVDAIILNPVDKIQSTAGVDQAFEAGIPVITVNTMSDSKNVAAHVGSDDVEAGKLQMERLIEAAKLKGIDSPKIAYIDAVLGHSAQVFRSQGYKEVLEAHPEATLVINDTANWSGEEALRLVENWMQAYDEIDIIAAQADVILAGAVTAVENAGKVDQIVMSGIDCDVQIMDKIAAGVVDSSLWQDGLGQGANALRIAIEAAKGNEVEDYYIPFAICNQDNIEEYQLKAAERDEISKKYF